MEGSVLVIEDEEPVRQLLAVNLQNAGYKVHCAGDIPQAEVLMRQIRPDLVVLSWILPGIPQGGEYFQGATPAQSCR